MANKSKPLDVNDAPKGHVAVDDCGAYLCERCAFFHRKCGCPLYKSGDMMCSPYKRKDGRSVIFKKANK